MLIRIMFISGIVFALTSLLILLHFTQKPLCIDTKIIDRIEHYSVPSNSPGAESKFETVFRCALFRDVPYSEFFSRNLSIIARNINQIYPVLEGIAPFHEKIRLVFFEGKDYLRVQFNQILLGDQIAFDEGVLAKALIQEWLSEKFNPQNETQRTIEKSLIDFLYFVSEGQGVQQPLLSGNERLSKALISTYLNFNLAERELFLKGLSFYFIALEKTHLSDEFDSQNEGFLIQYLAMSLLELKVEPFTEIYNNFAKTLALTSSSSTLELITTPVSSISSTLLPSPLKERWTPPRLLPEPHFFLAPLTKIFLF